MGSQSSNPRPARTRISVPAALGALALVAGAIVFGVLGPRMGQRGIRMVGTPLSEIRDLAVHLYGVRLLSEASDLESPWEDFSEIEDLGYESRGSEAIQLDDLGLDGLGKAASHWFSNRDQESSVLILEVDESARFVYFDSLGRQRPLLPGERVEESVDLNAVAWARKAMNDPFISQFERWPELRRILGNGSLGVVILGRGGRVVVVVAPDLDQAVVVADRIAPPLEAVEGREVAMEGYPWGSGWSDESGWPRRFRPTQRDSSCDSNPSIPFFMPVCSAS